MHGLYRGLPHRGIETRVTDLGRLLGEPMVLYRDHVSRCKICGAGVAADALLRRIEVSLGGVDESLRVALSSYCPSCRVLHAWGTEPSGAERVGRA